MNGEGSLKELIKLMHFHFLLFLLESPFRATSLWVAIQNGAVLRHRQVPCTGNGHRARASRQGTDNALRRDCGG